LKNNVLYIKETPQFAISGAIVWLLFYTKFLL